MISSITGGSHWSPNTWVVPSPSEDNLYCEHMPLSLARISYQGIQWASESFESTDTSSEPLDDYFMPIWVIDHPLYHEFFDIDLHTNEEIMEVMPIYDHPWGELYH